MTNRNNRGPCDAHFQNESPITFEELKRYERYMPADIRVGYYDGIVLYCDEDKTEARRFCEYLKTEIILNENERVKIVLYDCDELISLAQSKLKTLEMALDRCNYIFLYMTNAFCKDKSMELFSNECLMKSIHNEQERWRLIPIYTSSKVHFEIPVGYKSITGLQYVPENTYLGQSIKTLIELKHVIRKEKEFMHQSKQFQWLQEQKSKSFFPFGNKKMADRMASLPEGDDGVICVIKQYHYIKSNLVKKNGIAIAELLLTKGQIDDDQYERIAQKNRLRRHIIDDLLKIAILGKSDELRSFFDALEHVSPEIAGIVADTEVTSNDRSGFKQVTERAIRTQNGRTTSAYGGDVDDPDVIYFQYNLCSSPEVVDTINDAMLSRFHFSAQDHSRVMQCQTIDEQIRELFRKMRSLEVNAELELSTVLNKPLYVDWVKYRRTAYSTDMYQSLRRWIDERKDVVLDVFKPLVIGFFQVLRGSIILKFKVEDGFSIDLLTQESIQEQVENLLREGSIETKTEIKSHVQLTVFIMSPDDGGQEEIHFYLDFNARKKLLDYKAEQTHYEKELMSEELDPNELKQWIAEQPRLRDTTMLLEENMSKCDTSRKSKMEAILDFIYDIENGRELLEMFCKENDPYVYKEVFSKPNLPSSDMPSSSHQTVLTYRKKGGLQKLFSFRVNIATTDAKGELRVSRQLEGMRENGLFVCQRRLEYLGQRLQDLAVEIGDGQGAVWFKQNLWFLNKPAEFLDDVLFGVGKICNYLSLYLLFKKLKIQANFPLTTFVDILHDISDTLSIVRDILLQHPEEKLSMKQSQIELFWRDCTPFLFIFEEKKCSLLRSDQVSTFLYVLMDLIPTTIQIGLGLYWSMEPRFRGLDCFMENCLRLSKAFDEGEFLTLADEMEPGLIPIFRQWVKYALGVLQHGVKTRLTQTESKEKSDENIQKQQRPKTWSASSLEEHGDLEESQTESDPDAETCLGPLKVYHSTRVRATCLPSRWLNVALARMISCPTELRKKYLKEAGMKENQKLVSNIYLATGPKHNFWKGIKLHCPLFKTYEDLSLRLFVKVKKGGVWRMSEAKLERLYDMGQFLTFEEEHVEGFMAIEEIPMVSKEIGPEGGRLSTEYDTRIDVEIPSGVMRDISIVTMMIQPVDHAIEREYRKSCPGVFHCVKSMSIAVEINGASTERDIAIKIPFDFLRDAKTKLLVVKYTNDHIEVRDGSSLMRDDGNCYTVPSRNGGTVLATVDPEVYGQTANDSDIKTEMEVILGKKQLCKLLTFVEIEQNKKDVDNCVFQIVCAETYRVDEVIKEKSKSGLVEVPKSQSSDCLLKQADDIKLEIKGSIQLDEDIPVEAYTLTYLEGSDNYLRFPVKIMDIDGHITFILRQGKDNSFHHTFWSPISAILDLVPNTPLKARDLVTNEGTDEVCLKDEDESELQSSLTDIAISPYTESAAQSLGQLVNRRDIEKEAALKILTRNSIVILAKQMSAEEGHRLGVVLGMKPEKINQICKMYRHSSSLANFYVLYEWRGRQIQPDNAGQLVRGLLGIGRGDLANIVTNVMKKNRKLSSTDFETETARRKSRR